MAHGLIESHLDGGAMSGYAENRDLFWVAWMCQLPTLIFVCIRNPDDGGGQPPGGNGGTFGF